MDINIDKDIWLTQKKVENKGKKENVDKEETNSKMRDSNLMPPSTHHVWIVPCERSHCPCRPAWCSSPSCGRPFQAFSDRCSLDRQCGAVPSLSVVSTLVVLVSLNSLLCLFDLGSPWAPPGLPLPCWVLGTLSSCSWDQRHPSDLPQVYPVFQGLWLFVA